ncbi:MAG: hypothetical protein J7L69_08485, partial [Desulfobulbaceae bacterium]|nr:hypothetical protein [Desulfobulbaceae bacterium]
MSCIKNAQNILIFRTGQLGDTLVSIPALHVIREHYPTARITLLHDVHPNKQFVLASQVLNHSGLIDDFIGYDPNRKPRVAFLQTLCQIRRYRFDLLIYLPQSDRQDKQVKRDHIFFKLCGIKNLVGFSEFSESISPQKHKRPLPIM